VGLKYDTEVWREQWPRIMRNVIDACKRHGTRLVFLDNVYAYGRVDGVMTEDAPFNPCSRKGEVRAEIATMLLDEMRAGELQAMIVRSADFYGPGAHTSVTDYVVFQRLEAGKTPQWIGNPKAVHTFTYTPDVGRALAVLGQSVDAYGETWHAPTSPEPLTGEGFVRLACELAGRPYRLQVAPRWLLRVMGVFNPVLRENDEMMYHFECDYRFDSSRVREAFGLEATPYRDGIAATLQAAGAEYSVPIPQGPGRQARPLRVSSSGSLSPRTLRGQRGGRWTRADPEPKDQEGATTRNPQRGRSPRSHSSTTGAPTSSATSASARLQAAGWAAASAPSGQP